MKVYKVVREYPPDFVSATALGTVVDYSMHHTTTPVRGAGPLAAFNNRAAAVKFKKVNCPTTGVIFIAEAVRASANNLWTMRGKLCNFPLPSGTVFCESIILKRRLKS